MNLGGTTSRIAASAVLLGAGAVAGVLIVSGDGKPASQPIVVRQDAAVSSAAAAVKLPAKRDVVDVPSKLSMPSASSVVAVKKPAAVAPIKKAAAVIDPASSTDPAPADPTTADPVPVQSTTDTPVVSDPPTPDPITSAPPQPDPTPTETFVPPNKATNPNQPPPVRQPRTPGPTCLNAQTGLPC